MSNIFVIFGKFVGGLAFLFSMTSSLYLQIFGKSILEAVSEPPPSCNLVENDLDGSLLLLRRMAVLVELERYSHSLGVPLNQLYQEQNWEEKVVEIENLWSDLSDETTNYARKSTKKTLKVM